MGRKVQVSAPNGTAWLLIVEGEVANYNKQIWAESRSEGTGGGGYIGPQGGHVSAPSIHTTVTQRQQIDFWIRENDGAESQFSFTDFNFSVANGQRLRFAWGANMSHERGEYLFAHNFATNQIYAFKSEKWDDWCSREKLVAYPKIDNTSAGCITVLLAISIYFIGYTFDSLIGLNNTWAAIFIVAFCLSIARDPIHRIILRRERAKTLLQIESQKQLARDLYDNMCAEFNKGV